MKKSKATKNSDTQNSRSPSVKSVSKTVGLIIMIVILGSVTLITALIALPNLSANRSSAAEYVALRERSVRAEFSSFDFAETDTGPSALELEMLEINPNFVAWMTLDGTSIDYPVVRGDDNVRYLTTSFQGTHNRNGALFMDFRNLGDLTTLPHLIVYGHNSRQGGMFTDLHSFLEDSFLANNNTISLVVGNETLTFNIFSARLTDVTDYAYFIDFSADHAFTLFADRLGAPLNATQIITLSTCTNCSNDDARLIVQGYR